MADASTMTKSSTWTDLAGEYAIDPVHSRIGFSVRHAMVTNVHGKFEKVQGTISIHASDVTKSIVEVTADTASITTGTADRDTHLRSADFFDAEKYPTITFKSTQVTMVDEESLRVVGDLTMHGVTKPVELAVTLTGSGMDAYGKERVGFEATATINRKDWNLGWNVAIETGGVLVSEKVKLELDIAAVKNS